MRASRPAEPADRDLVGEPAGPAARPADTDAQRRRAGAGLRAAAPGRGRGAARLESRSLPDALARPDAAGLPGVMCTPGRADASVPPCGSWTWQPPAGHWFPGMGALKCRTVRDMLAARKAATTTPRPAANVGVTTSLRSAGPIRTPPGRIRRGRAFSGRAAPGRAASAGPRPARTRQPGPVRPAPPGPRPSSPWPSGWPPSAPRSTRASPPAHGRPRTGARCRGAALLPGDRIGGFIPTKRAG